MNDANQERGARERTAVRVVESFVASDDAPEGAELYDWWWLRVDERRAEIPLPVETGGFMAMADPYEPPAFHCPPTCEVEPVWFAVVASTREPVAIGWDRPHRIGVLFYGTGYGRLLPPIARPEGAVSDEGMRALVSSGCDVRNREAWLRLRALADELGLTEGEEWKREP